MSRNLSKFKQSVNCQKINPLTGEFLGDIFGSNINWNSLLQMKV